MQINGSLSGINYKQQEIIMYTVLTFNAIRVVIMQLVQVAARRIRSSNQITSFWWVIECLDSDTKTNEKERRKN